jgi:hypothetical protein
MSREAAQLDGLRRLVGNLEVYSAHCLKIKDKNGKLQPFIWNRGHRSGMPGPNG